IDFDFFIRKDQKTKRDTLYFVKPTDNRDGRRSRIFVFEWGKDLINFNPRLSIGQQLAQITVKGWDPETKKQISYTTVPSDLPSTNCGGTDGARVAQAKLDKKKQDVVDQPVTSLEEARELARSLLRERAYEFLTGTGQIIGLPDLRPGDNLELRGLGQRFSGTAECPVQYYVKKVTHTFGNSGYLTEFDVRSVHDGGTKKKEK